MRKQTKKIMLKTNLIALIFAAIFVAAGAIAYAGATINGAGATFPFPLYSQWAYKYEKINGTKLNYQSIGSGGGIAQIKAKTVDFGATDAPLTQKELDEIGLVQFPMAIGGVTPVVNIKGVKSGQLKLSPSVLSDIYLGVVTKWTDASIKNLNPGLKLPDEQIIVVRRSDGSGTTWIFTDYLAKVSPAFKDKVGAGKAVNWPTGVGGKGNEGVAAYVQKINASIGYVEYAYALQNKIPVVQLQNKAGKFVNPTIEAFEAAAINADWNKAEGFAANLNDQGGDTSWPIAGATFILMYKSQSDAAKAETILKFFDWCYKHGAQIAKDLHYIPIPQSVYSIAESRWATEITSGGAPVWKSE